NVLLMGAPEDSTSFRNPITGSTSVAENVGSAYFYDLLPPLTISRSGGSVRLDWTRAQNYTLQSSADLKTWSNVPGTYSDTMAPVSYSDPISGSRLYRRRR